MSTDELEPPADTMWERADESKLKVWFLISANRWLVVGSISVGTYLLLVLFGVVGPSSVENILAGQALGTVFGSVIIAVVTSVTLVLTVAQLVLSEQIDTLDKHRERMNNEIEFRSRIEGLADINVSPVQPNQFFRTLLAMVETRAEDLRDGIDESEHEAELSEVREYAERLIEHSRKTSEELEAEEFGTFGVLMPVLNYNYSWKIHAGRSLRSDYRQSLPRSVDDTLDGLLDVLRLFAPTREYFKSQYFQWEIVNIARDVLYGSMPALAVAGYVVLAFQPGGLTGQVLGINTVYLFVSAVYVIVLLPFSILLAYILRILTVVKRTLAIGPFILRATEAKQVPADVER